MIHWEDRFDIVDKFYYREDGLGGYYWLIVPKGGGFSVNCKRYSSHGHAVAAAKGIIRREQKAIEKILLK